MSSTLQKLVPGDRLLGRFRIDACFTGGMGLLWGVTDAHTGRRYAIKTIKPDGLAEPRVRARFREEAETWIGLGRHDHLVQAFWMLEAPEAPFLFLEFVPGRDLATLLEQGPLPLPRALDLAMQCAAGMAYAHAKAVPGGVGVVHRDLKPSNLLVTESDQLKVTDFGLARVFRKEGVGPGEEEARAGTPAYMAPEQLGGSGPISGRADIYSFGLVLHEMVTGDNPLAANSLAEQLDRILHLVPPPLTGVPETLAGLVARCVAKRAEDRPRDFVEVLGHLAIVAGDFAHGWHVDPRGVAPPSGPAGLLLSPPRLRPRRPLAGVPFAVEIDLRGDVGRGPVEIRWPFPASEGLTVLTPGGSASCRVEAGGRVALTLRVDLVAPAEAQLALPSSRIDVTGPAGSLDPEVAPFEIEVGFSFVLPLVGREAECGALEAAAREAVEGKASAILLQGDVGSGKTRLLQEASRIAAASGLRPVGARAASVGLRPMGILNDLAREILDLPEGEAGRVRAAVQALLGHEAASARFFAEVLLGGTVLEQDAPPEHHWFALLRAAASRAPLALLLDDVQNADEAAIGILVDLLLRARDAGLPVLLVLAASAGSLDARQRVRLDALRLAVAGAERRRPGIVASRRLTPLDAEQIQALVDSVFPGHGFREEAPWLVEGIAAATEGNPFHAAEILRVLRLGPGAVIARMEGEWRIPAELSPERLATIVPHALEAVVRQRLHSLSAATRDLLDHAALLGEEFDAAVLRAVVPDGLAIERALAELEAAGIARPVAREADRYRFWSGIVPPVIHRELHAGDPGRMRRLHRSMAEGMLLVYREEALRRRALAIAQMLRAAGEPERSLPFTLLGCQRLLSLHLPERARRLLANARSLAEAPQADAQHRLAWNYLYGMACEATGEYEEGLSALSRFVEGGRSIAEDARSLPRACARLGRIHKARGEYDRAAYCFGVAQRMLVEMGDLRAVAFLLDSLAELSLEQGQLAEAAKSLEQAEQLAREVGNEGASIQTAILKGQLALALGRDGEARRSFDEAESRARHLGDLKRLAAALVGAGRTALHGGYLRDARAKLEEAIELRARMGDRPGVATAMVRLGEVHQAAGRVARALRYYRRAQRLFGEIGQPEGVAQARLFAGRIHRARGKTTSAVRELAAAAEEYMRLGLPDRFTALRDVGEALVDAGSGRAARLALARADRGEAPGAARRAHRVRSRALRVKLALRGGEARRARALAASAARSAARTTGHGARILAQLALAESALRLGEEGDARRAAETALAFSHEQGDMFAAAGAERILCELHAKAGRPAVALDHAHRVARAYTGRTDAGEGPARLLLALAEGFTRSAPQRAARYLRAARRCYLRLGMQGFSPPDLAQAPPAPIPGGVAAGVGNR